jgi:hypothetical protein
MMHEIYFLKGGGGVCNSRSKVIFGDPDADLH